jgi:hypothetical protein
MLTQELPEQERIRVGINGIGIKVIGGVVGTHRAANTVLVIDSEVL